MPKVPPLSPASTISSVFPECPFMNASENGPPHPRRNSQEQMDILTTLGCMPLMGRKLASLPKASRRTLTRAAALASLKDIVYIWKIPRASRAGAQPVIDVTGGGGGQKKKGREGWVG